MACALTTGRNEPCKEIVAGIKKVIFMDYAATNFTVSAGQATAIDAGITEVFEFYTRADQTEFIEVPTSSRNNGTTIVTQTLNMRLLKQDYQTSAELILLAKARPIIVPVFNDGSYLAMGITDGADLTGGNWTSGQAKGDFNGYDVVFEAIEALAAPHLDSSTVAAIEALVSATMITP